MPHFSATMLLTRPEDASERFFRSLPEPVQARLDLVVAPLLRISPIAGQADLGHAAGVIFTSARALPFAGPPRAIPVFCVGEQTQRRAEQAGWQVRLRAPNADALVTALLAHRPAAPLVHVAGRHRRGDIAQRLSAQGVETREAVVYNQLQLPLSAQAHAALAGPVPVIVPLFSPRSAAILAAQYHGTAPLFVVAISAAALAPVQHLPAEHRLCAEAPNADAMRRAVVETLRRVEAADSPL